MTWIVLNLSLALLFVLAISGIPLWMTITHPDRTPNYAPHPTRIPTRTATPATPTAATPTAATPATPATVVRPAPSTVTQTQPVPAGAAT